jgi:hypothetical protein
VAREADHPPRSEHPTPDPRSVQGRVYRHRHAAAQTAAHEYGHVIWEFAARSSSPHPSLQKLRAALEAYDEEEFVEAFVRLFSADYDPAVKQATRHYAEVLKSEQEGSPP